MVHDSFRLRPKTCEIMSECYKRGVLVKVEPIARKCVVKIKAGNKSRMLQFSTLIQDHHIGSR